MTTTAHLAEHVAGRVTGFVLHERFDEQALRTPDQVALWFGEASITFADLRARADRIAGFLRAGGIGAGSSVGVHIDRSIQYVSSVLGVLKSGAAVVPLPPSYPEGRLRDILDFATLDAVMDGGEAEPRPLWGNRVIHFSDATGGPPLVPSGSGTESDPAFILSSSGSTGTPKLIVRSHRSFFHRLRWTWDNHPYTAGEVCCQKSHMTSTHAIYELFEPLLRGVPVVIIPDDDARAIEGFWETVRVRGVSRLLVVPSALKAALDAPGFVAPPLEVLVLMGEYVSPDLAKRVTEAFPETTSIYSIYGSTEASSTLVCDIRRSYRQGQELPLGTPISDEIQALVLDESSQPVGVGSDGLLHIGGPALFSGYFGNPSLTESVTRRAADGTMLYNTHDRVRLRPDGNLEFIGRVDHTVKVRGFRVDLDEVERACARSPGVTAAAVVLNDSGAGAGLIAFVSPETVDRTTLYQTLRDQLPAYMIPSEVVGIESFPRTPNGKVDRAQLRTGYANRARPAGGMPLRSATESRIAEVWGRVLGQGAGAFGPDSSFFEVGGTSLNVFQAVHRLRDAFDLDRTQLADQTIYRYPTVATLAAHIEALRSGGEASARPANSILVTLKSGEASLVPLFVIASAGGTLGAYGKLAKALRTRRAVIGVRDPFAWGQRDPTMGFQEWVGIYVKAIQERQPTGPYHVVAYSTAGAFGLEIAQHFRRQGHEVALLALIDPLALDRRSKRRFGYWAMDGMFRRTQIKWVTRLIGWSRLPLRLVQARAGSAAGGNNVAVPVEEFNRRLVACKRSTGDIIAFSILLELNTGLPFTLGEPDFAGVEPERYVSVLLDRVRELTPEVEPTTIENVFVQYNCLQVRAQHAYVLHYYDRSVVLFEPDGPQRGLLSALIGPRVRRLWTRRFALGAQSERVRTIVEGLPRAMWPHYLCMRDDQFVGRLAAELDSLVGD